MQNQKLTVILTFFLFLTFSLHIYAQPNLSKGVATSFPAYWLDNSSYSVGCNKSLLHAYKQIGITHFRVPISDAVLFQDKNPSVLNPAHLMSIDTAIVKKMIDSGFVVLFDAMHLLGSDSFAIKLANNTNNQRQKFIQYWVAVVNYFKKYPADKIAFEIYNEPGDPTKKNADFWYDVQNDIVQAIRKVDQAHWLVVTGIREDKTLDGLTKMKPIKAAKLIYNFHFYQPFIFVFQKRPDIPSAAITANLVYPSVDGCTDSLLAAGKKHGVDQFTMLEWSYYPDAKWGKDKIDKIVKAAYDFGQKNKVPVVCDEFMAFTGCPRSSRLKWLRDVTSTFQKYKIGYNMWMPDSDWTLMTKYTNNDKNRPAFDPELLSAVGLNDLGTSTCNCD